MTRPESGSDLTGREIEVLRLAAEGLTDPEIAGKLFISRNTVHSHFNRIMARLQVHTRARAVAIGYERRWLRTGWDPESTAAQVRQVRVLATRWARLRGASGRDRVLREAGRAVLDALGDTTGGPR